MNDIEKIFQFFAENQLMGIIGVIYITLINLDKIKTGLGLKDNELAAIRKEKEYLEVMKLQYELKSKGIIENLSYNDSKAYNSKERIERLKREGRFSRVQKYFAIPIILILITSWIQDFNNPNKDDAINTFEFLTYLFTIILFFWGVPALRYSKSKTMYNLFISTLWYFAILVGFCLILVPFWGIWGDKTYTQLISFFVPISLVITVYLSLKKILP